MGRCWEGACGEEAQTNKMGFSLWFLAGKKTIQRRARSMDEFDSTSCHIAMLGEYQQVYSPFHCCQRMSFPPLGKPLSTKEAQHDPQALARLLLFLRCI
jgi:hypothetical protein